MFGVALSAPSSSELWKSDMHRAQQQLSETSKAVLHDLPSNGSAGDEPWSVLDFAGVEESLAKKLNDDDIHAI